MSAGQRDIFTTAAQHAAVTMGLISSSGNIAKIELADSADANAKSWLKMANSAIDLVPLPGTGFAEEAIGFAVGQAKDKVFDNFEPKNGQSARVTAGTADDVAKTMLVDMAAAAMARHGLFGESAVSPLGLHPAGDERTFVAADGTLVSWRDMKSPQQHAYTNWIDSSDAGLGSVREVIWAMYDGARPGSVNYGHVK